jgi:hypothetical protein
MNTRKRYTHKSGKYFATSHLNEKDYVVVCNERMIGYFPKDLIENSSDWVQLIEVPIGEYYSDTQLDKAWSKAHEYLFYNIQGVKNLTVEGIINTFKKHFRHFLNQKNV